RGSDVERPRVRIEQVGLRLGVEESVVLRAKPVKDALPAPTECVLAVNRHEVAAELAQLAWRSGTAIDARHAAFADLALQGDGIEHRLHSRAIRAVPDLARIGPHRPSPPRGPGAPRRLASRPARARP